LAIVEVVSPDGKLHDSLEAPFTADGIAVRSGAFDGQPTPEMKRNILKFLEQQKLGERKVNYKLRDWVFSRQRYWGEPIPIFFPVTCEGDPRRGDPHTIDYSKPLPVPDNELPLQLPDLEDYRPGDPAGPLVKALDWRFFRQNGQWYARETNTMPQWAGSCWYYLRYTDARNNSAAFAPDREKYWMNVDLYVGGAEHAVLHLLYSRFWHKVLFDRGVVHTKEPFQRLFNQGLIQAFVFEDPTGRLVPNDEVKENEDGTFTRVSTGEKLKQTIGKMSKSLKNVIPADDVIKEYGADTLRLYEMFMGPLDGSKPWNPRDVPGMFRFLRDCWRMIVEDDERTPQAGNLRMNLLPSASEMIGQKSGDETERLLHKTIKGVTQDLERMAFNTAISKLMVFKNKALEEVEQLSRSQAARFLTLLAPFAPHIAEELWSRMRHGQTIALEAWPKFDEALTQDAMKEMAIQINGKIKGRITVAADAAEEWVKAQATEAIKADLAGKTVVKMVVVPGRLVNIVVK